MGCQSQNSTAPSPPIAPGAEEIDPRSAAESLASRPGGAADERLRRLVPGFDAPFFQAGLCGYSDAPMRLIARRHGCPFCVTEALLDRTLLAGGRGFAKADLGEIHDNVPGGDEDHPLAGQIMGSEPAEMAAAAVKMVEQGRRADREYRMMAYAREGSFAPAGAGQHLRLPGGEQIGFYQPLSGIEGSSPGRASVEAEVPARTFAVIDVNLACPVKKVDRKARGGHWLAEPEGAIRILEAVREAVPAEIPCAVKLRRAYDDTPEMAANFERVFGAAYDIGYSWATVHARTVEQRYIGPSRWTFLRELVARNPEKLVFGSGDIWSVEDIFRMIAYSGVHAVSVARGCIGNPWIFRQARQMLAGREPTPPTIAEQRRVLLDHFALALAAGGRTRLGEKHCSMQMRKFGIRFASHHPRGELVRQRFIAVSSTQEWHEVVNEFYNEVDSSK